MKRSKPIRNTKGVMRALAVAIASLLLAVSARAQDRVVTMSYSLNPTLVELGVAGTAIGPVQAVSSLPPHLADPEMVVVSGARHLAWMAIESVIFGPCHKVVVIF